MTEAQAKVEAWYRTRELLQDWGTQHVGDSVEMSEAGYRSLRGLICAAIEDALLTAVAGSPPENSAATAIDRHVDESQA